MWAEAMGQILESLSWLWQPDANGSRRRAWLIIGLATLTSAVLAAVAFTDLL